MNDGLYGSFTYLFSAELDGLTLMSSSARAKIVESIRQQVKITPGEEKRWEETELPVVQKLCSTLNIKFKEDGTVSLSAGDPSMEPVLLAYSRGSSWFSSVNMIEAVTQGLVSQT